MEDLRVIQNNKKIKKPRKIWLYLGLALRWCWKHKWKILMLTTLALFLFNPVGTATVIANWINDFWGTLIETIQLWN
jgi:hypothetical protein